MKRCPWCNNKAVVKNIPQGYFAECEKNGHIHNIGVFENAKCFSKSEKESMSEWDKQVKAYFEVIEQ